MDSIEEHAVVNRAWLCQVKDFLHAYFIAIVVTVVMILLANADNYLANAGIAAVFWAACWAIVAPAFWRTSSKPFQHLERKHAHGTESGWFDPWLGFWIVYPDSDSKYEHGVYDAKAEVWNIEEWTPTGGHRKYQVPEKNPPPWRLGNPNQCHGGSNETDLSVLYAVTGCAWHAAPWPAVLQCRRVAGDISRRKRDVVLSWGTVEAVFDVRRLGSLGYRADSADNGVGAKKPVSSRWCEERVMYTAALVLDRAGAVFLH